jgi:hypothetical protein
MDTRLDSRLQSSHGARSRSEPLGKLDFGLEDLLPGVCHSSKDVTWQQAQSELVRIVKYARFGDSQIECRGGTHDRTRRTVNF